MDKCAFSKTLNEKNQKFHEADKPKYQFYHLKIDFLFLTVSLDV